MKHLIRLFGAMTLMLISHAVWSFSWGFDSANPDIVINFIQQNNALIYLGTFFIVGILLAFTPCVLPMVPILSGIIVGQDSLSTPKAIKLSLGYVLGMAITYATAGMLAGFMGSTVQTLMQRPVVIVGFSLLFVLMALSMLGLFELRLPTHLHARLNRLSQRSNKSHFLSTLLMGVISTLIVSPCVTAPLIGVLTYISQSGQALNGGLILFVMALGMGIPLIIVAAGYGSLLPKTGAWMIRIKQLFGIVMLAIAIWMSGRVLPVIITHLLWAVLFIATGFTLAMQRSIEDKSARLSQILGIIVLGFGSIFTYSMVSPFVPAKAVTKANTSTRFLEVNTLQGIQQELARAKKENKPVFLEFSASWCSDCQDMDTKVFNQPEVIKAMKNLFAVKVNLSENNQEVADIKKSFAIYGTPTLLFFDAQGQRLNQFTSVGYISKTAMLSLLKQASSHALPLS
ncbi:protein-disulfide reductase DsbD [Legionella maceachernii]|uniref:Thiol:disulfide interchange protein DsbD n=2 Tax=Legionella TaxID=445 RepID=A0A0W0W4A5_9GAMM|nr:protein-disulfide reductase DsbD [Legionella maceachernii]KTD27011.1 thiol:disulfide interchange protein DsbD [Legionella maceachernii]SKA03127.1 thiol:disulfide interchange protein DsbD [Legionella maceachernii]SUP00154.1 Thiol:disulfide interchange protein DsbD precursor [Legionella maceachernii]